MNEFNDILDLSVPNHISDRDIYREVIYVNHHETEYDLIEDILEYFEFFGVIYDLRIIMLDHFNKFTIYLKRTNFNRWKEIESIIARYPYESSVYADNVIKDRWIEAETSIIGSIYDTFYTTSLIADRWYEAEPYIMLRDPTSIFRYAMNIIHGKWKEAEPLLYKDKDTFHNYQIILSNPPPILSRSKI